MEDYKYKSAWNAAERFFYLYFKHRAAQFVPINPDEVREGTRCSGDKDSLIEYMDLLELYAKLNPIEQYCLYLEVAEPTYRVIDRSKKTGRRVTFRNKLEEISKACNVEMKGWQYDKTVREALDHLRRLLELRGWVWQGWRTKSRPKS